MVNQGGKSCQHPNRLAQTEVRFPWIFQTRISQVFDGIQALHGFYRIRHSSSHVEFVPFHGDGSFLINTPAYRLPYVRLPYCVKLLFDIYY
jgi:hypothetical protein